MRGVTISDAWRAWCQAGVSCSVLLMYIFKYQKYCVCGRGERNISDDNSVTCDAKCRHHATLFCCFRFETERVIITHLRCVRERSCVVPERNCERESHKLARPLQNNDNCVRKILALGSTACPLHSASARTKQCVACVFCSEITPSRLATILSLYSLSSHIWRDGEASSRKAVLPTRLVVCAHFHQFLCCRQVVTLFIQFAFFLMPVFHNYRKLCSYALQAH